MSLFCLPQATIDKLLSEGVQLNGPAVRPQEGRFSEEDPKWLIYRWTNEGRHI